MKLINIYNDGRKIYLFGRQSEDKLIIKTVSSFFPYYYEPAPDGNAVGFDGTPLRKLIVSHPKEVRQSRSNKAYEGDIIFTRRYLIDSIDKLDKAPIKYGFIDVEILSEDLPDVQLANKPISCISIYNSLHKSIQQFYLGDYETEYKMLEEFMTYLRNEQFDLILGWNFTRFDYPYLFNRIPDFAQKISPIGKARYGDGQVFYPAGTSIIDYLHWFKKVTLNKEQAYSLDYIAEKHLGAGKKHKPDFSKLSQELKERNKEDVELLSKLEEKFKLISYYDEVRRLSKVEWEDMAWNCIDENTDILTNNGWKNHKNITKQDLVYSLNPLSHKLEQIPIEDIFIYDYDGDMIEYDNNRVNFCVTPNHKFLMYQKRKERNKNGLVFEYVNSIPEQRRYFIIGSQGFDGKFESLTDNQIKLLGWIISEGHLEVKTNAILIYQTENKYANQIEKILKSLSLNYTRSKGKVITFHIPACEALPYRILLNNRKRLPNFVYDLTVKQKRILIDTLIKGDGHKSSENSCYYCSSDKILIQQFQKLCILGGYNAYISHSIHTLNNKKYITYYAYVVKDSYRIYNSNKKNYKKYKGKVWCISNYYQNFLIRRNNRITLTGNSRIIDMLLLQEARNQKVVLPMKPADNEKEDFEGAFREAFQTGRFENLGKYDLSSAYPYAIINFCLDPANIIKDYVGQELETKTVTIEDTIFDQNEKALLPTVVKKLITLKNDIKQKLSTLELNTPEHKDMKIKYDAIKSIVNSAYGVTGNRFFRLYDKRIASATTYIVRDVLHYVKDKLEEKGYPVVYVDTDSVFIQSKEDLTELCNNLVQQWAKEKFGKDKVNIEFEYEGLYNQILILTKCRYVGRLKKKKGIELEIKGVEAKRKDSTIFMKAFQKELINKILDNEKKEKIIAWIKEQIDIVKEQPLQDISFPCKLARSPEEYKNTPIFLRALRNTESFDKRIGEPYYYIFMEGKDDTKKQLVLAFDEEKHNHINKETIDWKTMIKRNIIMKLDTIFNAMGWDVTEVYKEEKKKRKKRKKKEDSNV